MKKPPDGDSRAFFSGPFEPEEVRRLLEVIDENLRLRDALDLPGHARSPLGWTPSAEALGLDPTMSLSGDTLRGLTAPLFNRSIGGPLARAGKRLLNLPLQVLGRPQLHFNEAIRRVLASWSDLLCTVLDSLAGVQRALAEQRARDAGIVSALEETRTLLARLPELEAKVAEVERRLTELEPEPRSVATARDAQRLDRER